MSPKPSEIEKAKLSATYLNGIAVALAAVGGIAPWVAAAVQSGPTSTVQLFGSTIICLPASAGLHFFARTVLNRLDGR